MENNRQFVKRFDWSLAAILLVFLAISLLAIASAETGGQYAHLNTNFVVRQLQ